MSKQIDVVIGMNYGDEGKGSVVDYLVSKAKVQPAVVRFNSGAQAGHTVVDTNGMRHVFQHFGSGSFLKAPTILSRFFVVNPVLFFKERLSSTFVENDQKVYVDPQCRVTTPFDVILNRQREIARDNGRHGSCGIGFGETIQRDELGYYLRVVHMQDLTELLHRLTIIHDQYFWPEMEKLGVDKDEFDDAFIIEAQQRFVTDAHDFMRATTMVDDEIIIKHFDHVVFEGAQGLRLNQYSEDFPFVTRSSTGLENVATLLNDIDGHINVHYLTRSYLTRHGAGPLEHEIDNPGVIDKTNIDNDYQGALRFASQHDFLRMRDDVARDKKFLPGEFETTAVITCCDQYHMFGDNIDAINTAVMLATEADHMLTSHGSKRNDFKVG